MKDITAPLIGAQSLEVTTLCTCWKVARQDGREFGFTDHDKDLTIDGLVYKASSGFDPHNVETTLKLNVDTTQADAVIGVGTNDIATRDVLAGLWDGAAILVFQVDYANLARGAMPKRRGWLGEVSVEGGRAKSDLRGLMQALQQEIGRIQTGACGWDFCDANCGLPILYHTHSGTVTAVDNSGDFTAGPFPHDAHTFTGGLVTWVTGLNAGIEMEVKFHNGISGGEARFKLQLGMPFPVAIGDTFEVTEGCDKSWQTCEGKFANLVNFGGFCDIPGADKLTVNVQPTRVDD